MLRNLNQSFSRGRICGTPHSGVLAAAVMATVGGEDGNGLLVNDVLPGDPAGCEYRVEILTWPSAGTLFVYEDGSALFSDAPDGIYTGQQRVWKNGIDDGTSTYTFAVGNTSSINAGAGTASATGPAATITRSYTISAGFAAAAANGHAAEIRLGTLITGSIGNAVAGGLTANVGLTRFINAAIGSAVATGRSAEVSLLWASSPMWFAVDVDNNFAAVSVEANSYSVGEQQ